MSLSYRGKMAFADRQKVSEGLYIGSAPEIGSDFDRANLQVLVLCADEYQPSGTEFRGRPFTMHVPLDDSGPPPTLEDLERAHSAARVLAGQLLLGKRALVTCRMGVNRSGLVTALAHRLRHRTTGHEARVLVQKKRTDLPPGFKALQNQYFADHLDSLGKPRV